MKYIELDKIVIEGRQRDEVPEAHCKQLAAGILKVGLLHPIVLRDDHATLVAGESRTKAAAFLYKNGETFKCDGAEVPVGCIPYTTIDECDEILAQEAELLENALRLDLTWQQKDKAILKIKRMAELKAGGKKVSHKEVAEEMLRAQGIEEPSQGKVYDTKNKVDMASLREEYADDERVAKAKSASEADRIIKKDMERKKREKLSEQFKDVASEHTIKNGDCCELIKEISDGTYDVICSDPIYGINADDMHMFQRAQYNKGSHHEYDDSWENWDRMFSIMPDELYRVAKDDAALYLCCDINRFFDFYEVKQGNTKPSRIKGLRTRFAEAGWTVWARPLVWYKGNIGSIPKPEHGPRYTTEYVMFAYKGDKKTTQIYHDLINVPQVTGHVHAAGKPPEFYLDLLKRSANPGDMVLDFNAGSFPILPAANTLGCIVHAWELNEKWMVEADLRKMEKIG
jgi:DNA modification methylase